jgi:hypothetical protein
MAMTCITIFPFLPAMLAGVLVAGVAIGFSLRLVVDYAELAAYRRVSRRAAERDQ